MRVYGSVYRSVCYGYVHVTMCVLCACRPTCVCVCARVSGLHACVYAQCVHVRSRLRTIFHETETHIGT